MLSLYETGQQSILQNFVALSTASITTLYLNMHCSWLVNKIRGSKERQFRFIPNFNKLLMKRRVQTLILEYKYYCYSYGVVPPGLPFGVNCQPKLY